MNTLTINPAIANRESVRVYIEAYEHSPKSLYSFIACEEDLCEQAKQYLEREYGFNAQGLHRLEERLSSALCDVLESYFKNSGVCLLAGYDSFCSWLLAYCRLNSIHNIVLRNAFLGAFTSDERLLSQVLELYLKANDLLLAA
jgi:hypothetical protein